MICEYGGICNGCMNCLEAEDEQPEQDWDWDHNWRNEPDGEGKA